MNADGKFCILALDGGGIRGIITIGLLQRLEAESGVDLIKNVDLIAGTSTGGAHRTGPGCWFTANRNRETLSGSRRGDFLQHLATLAPLHQEPLYGTLRQP